MIGALAWLTGSTLGRYAALGLLAAAAIGLILWRVFAAGKAASESATKINTLTETINALSIRIATDESLRALSPDARRDRLRQWAVDP